MVAAYCNCTSFLPLIVTSVPASIAAFDLMQMYPSPVSVRFYNEDHVPTALPYEIGIPTQAVTTNLHPIVVHRAKSKVPYWILQIVLYMYISAVRWHRQICKTTGKGPTIVHPTAEVRKQKV